MGCCYSSDTTSEHNGEYSERSHLLANPASNSVPSSSTFIREDNIPRQACSLPKKKNDEQSALSRILHETATTIIDVSQLENNIVEQHEYMDRTKVYQSKLQAISTSSADGRKLLAVSAPPGPKSLILEDVPNVEKVLSATPISGADFAMVREMVKNLSEAVKNVRVEHREELVVQFGIPEEEDDS